MTIHLSNDLMLVGKISSWANRHNLDYKNAANLDKLRELLESESVQVVLVDLQFRDLDIVEAARLVKDQDSNIQLCGYAQHVFTDLLATATQAGFDEVLTRGQFDRNFSEFL